MTDAEFEAQEKRLQPLLDKWCAILRLNFWTITYVWARHAGEMREGHENATACCKAIWTHFEAVIHWNLEEFAKLSDQDTERIVIHEHLHILTAEMAPEDAEQKAHWRDHEERVVSTLAQLFLWQDKA